MSKRPPRNQRGVSSHKKPTQEQEEFWLYVWRQQGTYPEPTERCGKWMVFINVAEVDEVWSRIAQAVEQGMLGSSAKVATMRPNSNAKSDDEKVICVYSYDSEDRPDLLRILTHLRSIGVASMAFYKEDAETLAGNYAGRGGPSPTKYYAKPGQIELLIPKSRR